MMVRRTLGAAPGCAADRLGVAGSELAEEREGREKRGIEGKESGEREERKREKKIGCSGFRKSKPEFITLSIFFERNFVFDRLRRNFNFKENCFEN